MNKLKTIFPTLEKYPRADHCRAYQCLRYYDIFKSC